MNMNMQRKQITAWALGLLILSFWGASGAWAGTITLTEDQTPYANKGQGSVTIGGAAVNFLDIPGGGNATIVAIPNAGSYFFRWSGDKITEQNQYSRTNVIAVGANDSVAIEYLFSGEVGPTDNGFGDLDNDGLADFWEVNAGLDPTTANGANGKFGNQDGDLIPNVLTADGWPLVQPRLLRGYNTGAPFNNFLEQSGLNGHWETNYPGPTRGTNSDDSATSPTEADSDGDGMPDGWEYYFWYWRGAGAYTHGGTPLSWVGLDPIVGNDPTADTDGDGLNDFGEYTAGTDPTHCDTDRDGMDDGWEVANLLNPLDPGDAGGNPDGDKMAADGLRFNDSVYRKGVQYMEAGETAFDPRTAWADGTNVTGTAHPDTIDYSNIHEYLGRDRRPRISWDVGGPSDGLKLADGADDATNPQAFDTDGDSIPDGWELYVGMNPKDGNDAGNDHDVNNDKGDGLGNAEEWRNARAAGGNGDALGTWTNKLWPTDPGHIQDGTTYGEGNIVFAWRNVWMSGETNVVYSPGVDTPVFYGGWTNQSFYTPNGAPGTTAGLYYHDANNNLRWDFGEDIWKISSSYNDVTNQVYGGGDGWTAALGQGGIQQGLYYYDGNGDGSYSPGEEIWRNELNVYNTNRDMAVWGGGHAAGFTATHGAVGKGLTDNVIPMYYDWFINLYVGIMWSKPGDTNMATLPFDPATDTVWLDIGVNGIFDGEQMIVGTRPPVGTRGLGLAYVFVESSSNYWIDRSGVVGTYDASDVLLAGTPGGPGSPAPSIVFWDANNDQVYTAGEVVWKDTVVADSLYTHDYQVYNTNAVLISGGHRGSQIGMYFYHNDPHPADTDFDGLEDGEGKAYYSNIPFGEKNLLANPTTIDSDTDALPDGWEAYAGTQILVPDASPGQAQGVTVPEEADDETILLLGELEVGPLEDPDGDGLVNNQEYLTGVNYEWMHIDIWKFPTTKLGTRQPMTWDRKAEGGNTAMRADWIGVFIPPDFPTCPSFSVDNGQRARSAQPYVFYHTTKANKADTDDDGMDDYWEIYHGLNPLKGAADYMAVPRTDGTRKSSSGAQVGLITVTNDYSDSPHLKFGTSAGEFTSISNLVKSLQTLAVGGHVGPFNMGLELMDPDADGLPNLEEYSYEPGDTGRSFYHTDPTAFIRTDVATGFKAFTATREQVYSFTRDNYTLDNIECPCKWKWKKDSPAYPFAFEEVDGFDTDNDGYGDFAELNSSLPNATGGSDPIDSRDPVKNRALFLVATNQDFVRTLDSWVVNIENHLTRFTVEAWVMPTATGQVWQTAVERDTQLPADWFGSLTRSNFRLGLTTNNLPYVMYNGRGPLESSWTFSPASYRVPANKWSHLAATYDGQKVRLYVNGVLAFVTDSEIIPATGYNDRLAQRKLSTTIVGAREPDNTNDLWGAPSVLFNDTLLSGEPCYGTAGFSLFSLSLQAERAVPVYATEFFNGYLDEIRVWNGVRSQTEIQSGMRRKLARTEGAGTLVTLEYYYNFDDCPDVDINWSNYAGVAVADEPRLPANINAIQRPGMPIHRTLYAWNLTPQRSQVYYGSNNQTNSVLQRSNQWNYIVMAEDVALHKAVNPPQDDKFHPDRTTNGTYTGTLPVGYKNSANPYENRAGYTKWAWERTTRDLVFLNGAQADGDVFVSVDSWIPGITTNPDERDTDGDGMPDNWETENGLDPYDATGDNGAQGDMDNDGLTNIYEYLANLSPNDPDSNGNGIADGDEDNDGDGLTNRQEQDIGTYPLVFDTDDDGLSDGEEVTGGDNIASGLVPMGSTDPLNSLDPPARRSMLFNGSSRVIVPPQTKLMSTTWTIEMWVQPTNSHNGVLISRYVEDLVSGQNGINYEMGVSQIPGNLGLVSPYIRYRTAAGADIVLSLTNGIQSGCDEGIPVGEWTHLAGVYSATNHRMEIYINGERAGYRVDSLPVPPTRFGYGLEHEGDEVTVGASRSSASIPVVDGFQGLVDEVRMWATARTATEIKSLYRSIPLPVGGEVTQGTLYEDLPSSEKAVVDTKLAAALQKAADDGGLYSVAYSPVLLRSMNELCGRLYNPSVTGDPAHVDTNSARLTLPSSFNWMDRDGVTPVKDQGSCGSCWAFGTVAPFESAILIGTKTVVDLSEQYLVSCNLDGYGCGGGLPAHQYHYDKPAVDGKFGGVYESALPYAGEDSSCGGPYERPYVLEGWAWIGSGPNDTSVQNDAIKQAIYKYGPVAVSVYVGPSFTAYDGGIFNTDEESPTGHGNHCVTLVGWNDAEGYWIMKNSWGTSWGENGYMRIAYGTSGIGEGASYVVWGRSSRVAVALDLRFDDGGITAEDFTVPAGWVDGWRSAARLDGAVFTNTYSKMLDLDSDGDGMPDWWEMAYGLDPENRDDGLSDPDGDTLINLYEFLSGTHPRNEDSNLNYVLDGNEDSDGDELVNYLEQVQGSSPAIRDTDDDGLTDRQEFDQALDPSDSVSPYVMRYLRNNGTGYVTAKSGSRFDATNWVVEAAVRLTSYPVNDVLLVRRQLRNSGYVTFELGIAAATRLPYVRFNTEAGVEYRVNGYQPLETNVWYMLSGKYGDDERTGHDQLALFQDNQKIVQDVTDTMPAMGGECDTFLMASNLPGDIDEVRVWNRSRTDEEIWNLRDKSLQFGSDVAKLGSLDAQGGMMRRQISNDVALSVWTVEAWFKTDGAGTIVRRDAGLACRAADRLSNYKLAVNGDGYAVASFDVANEACTTSNNNDYGTIALVATGKRVADNSWHHAAFTFDGASAIFYIDGVLEEALPFPVPVGVVEWYDCEGDAPISWSACGVTVCTEAGYLEVGGDGYDGLIDEVRVFRIPVSQNVIRERMFRKVSSDAGLVSYFDYDDEDISLLREVRDKANSDVSGQLRSGATVAVDLNDNAPITFTPLEILRPKLAAYFPMDDGRDVTLNGARSVEDLAHPLDWEYAASLLPSTNEIDFVPLLNPYVGTTGATNHPSPVFVPTDTPWRVDSDSDGMPDAYEQYYRFDPNRSDVVGNPDINWYGDSDKDGLNNLQEYLAGTNPRDWDSDDDGIGDYDDRSGPGSRTYGELYDDGDGLADAWEIQYPSVMSPLTYDADDDPDGDGWSNFGEFMNRTVGTNATLATATDPLNSQSYPTPQVAFTFKYTGLFGQGPIRVQAYSTPAMDGTPDAELVLDGVTNFVSPYLLTTNQFTTGHLRQGPAWFYAYFDRNADGTWNEGEPAGLSQYQPTQIGFGSVPEVIIGMSDGLPGYKRFSWPAAADANSYTVSVWRKSGAAVQVVSRIMKAPRTYFHEGDYRYAGYYGMPTNSYDWYVRAIQSNVTGGIIASNAFRIDYPVTLLTPVPYLPPSQITFARNTFVWSMDTNATQFRLQISRDQSFTSTNPFVCNITTNAPYIDADGRVRYTLPVYAGDGAWSNGLYYWRVRALNTERMSDYSVAQPFTVNLQESPVGAYTIAGAAFYFGKVTNGQIIVQAFRSAGFSGVPEAQVTLTNKGDFKLMGLRAGTYYVRAFIDQNGNRYLDTFESFGFVKDTLLQIDYSLKPLSVPGNVVGQQLVIRDHDADDDGMPDAWEYQFFGNLTTASHGTDFDGDGLTDLREYEIEPMDTDPTAQDTDGDGLTDYQEVFMDGSGEYTPWPLGGDTNPHLADTDGDGIPDGAEADIDGDGYDNNLENVLGSNPLNSAIVPPTSSLFVWGVSLGATVDVVTFDFDKPAVTGIRSNVQAKLMTSTNLMQGWTQPAGYTRNIYTTNWSTGPWTFNYTHPLNEAARSYYIDWMIKP